MWELKEEGKLLTDYDTIGLGLEVAIIQLRKGRVSHPIHSLIKLNEQIVKEE